MEPLELLERIAQRHDDIADDFNRRATIDIHRKQGHVGYLRSEAALIRSAIVQLHEALDALSDPPITPRNTV